MSATAQSGADAGGDRDRIVNLSDGVFAIAIVLLVLDIRVPNIPEKLVASELPGELLSLWPQCLGYVLSFVSISVFWMIHHAIFRPIRSYDRTLLYLNFLFLMLGASLPHGAPWRVRRPPTAGGHLRRDPCDRQAALDSHTLVLDKERSAACRAQDPAMVRFFLIRGLTIPAIFLLSIGISFFSVGAAIWTWFIIIAIDAIIIRKGLPQ